MNGRPWTAAEIRVLRRMYPDHSTAEVSAAIGRPVNSCYQRANSMGLKKSAAYLATTKSGRIQRGRSDPRMTATQFKPGLVPWNKGTHWTAGGRSAETRFKNGCRSIRWDEETYALGALRITTNGTLLIKATPDTHRSSWEIMARFVWRTERGPIPRGFVVRAKNGDSHDTRIENLKLLSRADNIRRNSFWTKYPKDVARLIQLKGAINRQANRIAREAN